MYSGPKVHTYVHIYVHIYIYIYIHIERYTDTDTDIDINTDIYIYIYIYRSRYRYRYIGATWTLRDNSKSGLSRLPFAKRSHVQRSCKGRAGQGLVGADHACVFEDFRALCIRDLGY